jgi:alcohol dehydrogenase class IV
MEEIMTFQYHLPVNLLFGRGRIKELGVIAAMYGKRALIVTGQNSTKKTGLLERAVNLLKEAGAEVVIFDQVSQNPMTTTAEKGAELAREEGCSVVIGLGGGSIMDCAKAIAFLICNEGDINDYIFNRKTGTEAQPLILIPTTCGTGSEGNGFAVLTNPKTGDKKSLRTNAVIANASIIDSELMQTMPASVLASVGFDALCHSMEAYLSKRSQSMTDLMSLEAMKLLGTYLAEIYQGAKDAKAWDAVTWASTIGGMVIHTAGVTLPHGMEHPASGLKNIVHGRGLAALTPVITEASIPAAPEKYKIIAECLGGDGKADCAEVLRGFLKKLDLNVTLSDQGITEGDIAWMSENCFKVSAAGIANHPAVFTIEEIQKLYRKAL